MVIVSLSLATICALGQCFPALVGNRTPVGDFQIEHVLTKQAGLGGDILMYEEGETRVKGIHRVYTLVASQRREERLASPDPKQRQSITDGCINVAPNVYTFLRDCCSKDILRIVK